MKGREELLFIGIIGSRSTMPRFSLRCCAIFLCISSSILHPSSFLFHPSSFLKAAVAVADRPKIEAPSTESVREQVRAWLAERQSDEAVAAEAERLWQTDDPALGTL